MRPAPVTAAVYPGLPRPAGSSGRRDTAACLANLCQAVLATAEGRLAAAGEWALNEKRIVERAGLGGIQDRLGQPAGGLSTLVSEIGAALDLTDAVWSDG